MAFLFSIPKKQSQVKCNLILIYVMICVAKCYYFGKIPWIRVGTFFLKIFYLKRDEFPLECVIHDSYSIGAPNENIVQNHLNIALLNVF